MSYSRIDRALPMMQTSEAAIAAAPKAGAISPKAASGMSETL